LPPPLALAGGTGIKMDIVVLGHSFVRRLRDGLIPPVPYRHSHDIHAWNATAAAQLASAWGISDHVRHVYTYSDGIVRIRDVDRAVSTIQRIRPCVVLIDIGSNDLAHVEEVDPPLMLRLATQLTDFAIDLAAHKVILNAILPRTGNITCPPAVFRDNAEHFNNFLYNICDPKSKLVFHKPRGFWKTHVDGKERLCEVAEWSSDGIHCTLESMRRYSTRTKRAIITQVRWLSKQTVKR
jgi:hypothetical protein